MMGIDYRQRKFTASRMGVNSEELIEHTMYFASTLAKASSSIFFWVGAEGAMVEPRQRNIAPVDIKYYEKNIGKHDPLHVTRLSSEGRQLSSLSQCLVEGVEISECYMRRLATLQIRDEINLLFWQEQKPIACLALFRQVDDRPFNLDDVDWNALHSFLQSSLKGHWRARSTYIEDILVQRFDLKPRELDVVEWLVHGKSNWEIGQILGISESTVKVHVKNILKKLGVESRLGISYFLSCL